MHPTIRVELARWHRQEQIEAAAVRRIEVEAAAGHAQAATQQGPAAPRLRPQQSRP
ncbi:MAG TPA: hypothetical protein VGL44_17485 [Gaiellales bacterium]